jgi:hypothetical protein
MNWRERTNTEREEKMRAVARPIISGLTANWVTMFKNISGAAKPKPEKPVVV